MAEIAKRERCTVRPVFSVKGDEMTATWKIDAKTIAAAVTSSSGKSHVICTTGGLVPVSGTPVRVNLTVTD